MFRHGVLRVKRSEKLRQAEGLFNAAMEGNINLFKEMRRVRRLKSWRRPWTVAPARTTLYNSAESSEEMVELQKKIQEIVESEDSETEVQKMTTELVK